MSSKLNFIKSNVNLFLSLKPSFILALFKKVKDNVWVKVAGYGKGTFLMQIDSLILSNVNIDVMKHWSGLWYNPREVFSSIASNLDKKNRRIIERLVESYSDLSLCVSPYDKDLLIVPIILSRRTDYERNVLRWCLRIWEKTDDIKKLVSLNLTFVGSSYQITQLQESLKDFIVKVHPYLEDETPDDIRRRLLSCKWVGPKVADAYLLFTGIDTSASPVDVHLLRMLKRIPLVEYGKIPQKNYCIKYSCKECPISEECVRSKFSKLFGKLAGWIQTVFYVQDRFYCMKKLCSICRIKDLCNLKRV